MLTRDLGYGMIPSFSDHSFCALPQAFDGAIERDEDGLYVGELPQLLACYAQGETIDELMVNIREAIELCLENGWDEEIGG